MQKESITIIDYGLGNIKSLVNAFNYIGANIKLSDSKRQLEIVPNLYCQESEPLIVVLKKLKKERFMIF